MGNRLVDRVAVVTGAGQGPGVGIGNGRATAITFAREGARVVVVDRDPESADETVSMIAAEGGKATTAIADVATDEGWAHITATAAGEFGGLDIVHHNVRIVVVMARAVLPALREQGRGVITNISSLAATATGGAASFLVAYKMSKAAMNAVTTSLAVENARYGIRVNAIAPGLIDTPMGVDGTARMLGIDRAELAAKRDAVVPLKGGMGTAWDVANAGLFLASDDAKFITGVILPVDGGQGARIG